ncbi:MAG TPA: hypothetical protein VD790_08545 [Thermoleophilaceae bacterium]|nr:hypothetical protein [Thermoleophilaceae bacterium]
MSSDRQRRKQRKRQAAVTPPAPSRSEQKNAAVRAELEPLEPGERPTAVTVGAIVAAALGLVNIGLFIAGFEIDGERPQIVGVLSFSALMLAAAWGMWKARYWAVLGMQALLGLLIVILSIVLITAQDVWGVLLLLGIIVPAGTLFWFMVKAMARIQMPSRDQ